MPDPGQGSSDVDPEDVIRCPVGLLARRLSWMPEIQTSTWDRRGGGEKGEVEVAASSLVGCRSRPPPPLAGAAAAVAGDGFGQGGLRRRWVVAPESPWGQCGGAGMIQFHSYSGSIFDVSFLPIAYIVG
jgi:hypothetical protein